MSENRPEHFTFKPIGMIHSPFTEVKGMPIQPVAAEGVTGRVEVYPEFAPGLADLDGFSHLILIYAFHRVEQSRLQATPFLDSQPRGIFATRAPARPNPIGLSVVRLLSVEGTSLVIENVDVLDGTPLLDLKPYIPDFDHFIVDRLGWYGRSAKSLKEVRADDRFKD